MTCHEARTHTLTPSSSPLAGDLRSYRSPVGVQRKARMPGVLGPVTLSKSRGPVTLWVLTDQALSSVSLTGRAGPSGWAEGPRQGLSPLQGRPRAEALARPQASWTGVQQKVSNLLLKQLFQIILISFPFPFVLSLYDLNQFWFYL